MGCWTLSDATLVGLVTNATVSSLAKLTSGGYGARPLEARHALILCNDELTWRGAADIGQPWDRDLKAAAEELLVREAWTTLYSCRMLRTSRGCYGLLVGAYGAGFHLWPADDETSGSVRDELLLCSATPPPREELVDAINAAADAAQGGRRPGLLDRLRRR